MAQIAYILLCHKDPAGIVAQAERLTAAGDVVAIHMDARAARAVFAQVRAALAANARVILAPRRLRCGWGGWSLVAATLITCRAAAQAFPRATHFYLLSGDCMPIKPAARIRAQLDAGDADHIECVDFFDGGWIKTGPREERLAYRHWFNERSRKRLFYASIAVQARLGLRRAVPEGIAVQIGSQWWCLRRRTLEAVLGFTERRPDVVRFFRTTWIPDETYVQTLVRHLVPASEIRSRPPTFLMFSDYGMPVTFHDDHHDLLVAQDYLFARKISATATGLRARLGALYAGCGAEVPVSGEGRALYGFLTGQGRVGRRFAPRAWEEGATLGRERTLLVVACKKWHVAKRLVERLRDVAGTAAVDYLFDEAATPLPDLGGIGSTLEKRGRHPRALVRLLFDALATDRLAICIDPSRVDLLAFLRADRATLRVLEIECAFSDDDLAGHARRVGLAGVGTIDRLLPTLREDLRLESDRLHDAGAGGVIRLRERSPVAENAAALVAFLGVDLDRAERIARTDHLFAD